MGSPIFEDGNLSLSARLAALGFVDNDALVKLAQAAEQFAKEEDRFLANTVSVFPNHSNSVVCRSFYDATNKMCWLVLRSTADSGWMLDAVLYLY